MKLQKKAIPRGVHEMRSKIKKCEQLYIWDVTPPSLPRFGENPRQQCFHRPNDPTVPRLAVWKL